MSYYETLSVDDVTQLDFEDIETASYPQRQCTICGGLFVCFIGVNLCNTCTDFLWIAKRAVITESHNVRVQ